jgi:hypothetical protein
MPDFATISAIALAAYNVGKFGAAKYKQLTAKQVELNELIDGLKFVVALTKGSSEVNR